VRAENCYDQAVASEFLTKILLGGKLLERTGDAFRGAIAHGIVVSASDAMRFARTIKKTLRHAGFLHFRNFTGGAETSRFTDRIEAWRR
jgi:hypothetical protein